MARYLSDGTRAKRFTVGTDTNGDYVQYPNGKKMYSLTIPITAGTTTTTANAGDFAQTTNATGISNIYRSTGTVWQTLA